jgi:hypothetical protein
MNEKCLLAAHIEDFVSILFQSTPYLVVQSLAYEDGAWMCLRAVEAVGDAIELCEGIIDEDLLGPNSGLVLSSTHIRGCLSA